MITSKSIVNSIIFNIEIDGIKYKDVKIVYDKKDKLTIGDIHSEDNNSWHLVEIGGKTYDFQIYGDDDSIGRKNPEKIMNTRLSCQLYLMYESGGRLCHSSEILCNLDGSAKITYVRIDTNQGRKFVNLLTP